MGIQQVLLAAGPNFAINAENASSMDNELSPTDANAGIFFSGSDVSETNGAGFMLVTFGDPTLLELFVTGAGDTLGGTGAEDTWQTMGGSLSYTLSETGLGSKSWSGTYSVREAASGIVLGGGTMNISVTVDI